MMALPCFLLGGYIIGRFYWSEPRAACRPSAALSLPCQPPGRTVAACATGSPPSIAREGQIETRTSELSAFTMTAFAREVKSILAYQDLLDFLRS